MWHMPHILIFSIILPSFNNNTIFFHILLSIHLHHSFNSCVSVLPRASMGRLLPWTTHMRGSFSWRSWRGTKNFSTAPGLPMPSRPLLILYRLARVHQEDRSSSLARSKPLLKNVLSKCTPKNVLSKCTVKLVLQASSLLTSSHSGQACHVISCTSRAPSCATRTRVPLRNLVHHCVISCTLAHRRAPLVPLSCTPHKVPQLSWHFPLPGHRIPHSRSFLNSRAPLKIATVYNLEILS